MLVWCANSWDSLNTVSIDNRRNTCFLTMFFLSPDAFTNISAAFGQGTGSIHLDNVACVGTEDTITDCVYDADTSDCSHARDAGVTCSANCEFEVAVSNLIVSS